MATQRRTPEPSSKRFAPAKTPEAREAQLIGMAFDLAEQQLRDGTASAQVVTHLMKLGGRRNSLEEEKLRSEVEHLKAKNEQLAQNSRIESLYEDAIRSMRQYSGQEVEDDYED